MLLNENEDERKYFASFAFLVFFRQKLVLKDIITRIRKDIGADSMHLMEEIQHRQDFK